MEKDKKPAHPPVFQGSGNGYRYPLLDVPPAVQAQSRRLETPDGRVVYTLNYAGLDIVTITVPAGADSRVRFHSDSSMQTSPLIQQFYLSLAVPDAKAGGVTVALRMRRDAVCMRPERAGGSRAILAQSGGPLIYGANGFYGFFEDLLLEWHGAAEWRWTSDRAEREADGATSASFEAVLDRRPLILLLRPHFYSEHLGYRYYRPWEHRPNPKAVSGWCSWEACRIDVTEEKMAAAAEKMSELAPYGLEYIQLDDGYEQEKIPPTKDGGIYESWLSPNAKFPGGHAKNVENIRKHGLTPAIWSNAIVTNPEAADRLCMLEGGHAFRGDWIQYIFNCEEKSLREQVLPYYRGLRRFGYEYFKTDSIRHLFYDGMQECVRRGLLTEEEAEARFRAFIACAREGIGDDAYLLSCWGALTQAVGIADACRIATDATPEWSRVLMQVYETARWFFAQRVLFTVDPDHVCARTELPWARMLLSFVSLTGGLYMLSDPLECYDGERMEIIRRTLPSLEVYAAETGPVDYTTPAFCRLAGERTPEEVSAAMLDGGRDRFGTLWTTHFCAGDRRWAVALRAALTPLMEESVPLDALGLDPAGAYAAFDFWRQEFLGIVTGSVDLRALPLGHVQVCALTPVSKAAPTLVASDRHVSMDAVSVTGCRMADGRTALSLRGVGGQSFVYTFYSEAPCEFSSDAVIRVEAAGPLYRVTVDFVSPEAELTAFWK